VHRFNLTAALFLLIIIMALFGCTGRQKATDDRPVSPPATETAARQEPPVGVSVGNRAPELDGKGLDGQPVRLSDYRGKVVLLNFWATWCVPCRKEMPDIQALAQAHAGQLQVIAVNVGEDSEAIRAFMNELELELPVVLDRDMEITRKFMVIGLPTTYFINREGRISVRAVGQLDRHGLEHRLAEAGLSVAETKH
jgi:cytochrome c biogenesis protein CcmG/thiol:disulfide interchange protein DsbE